MKHLFEGLLAVSQDLSMVMVRSMAPGRQAAMVLGKQLRGYIIIWRQQREKKRQPVRHTTQRKTEMETETGPCEGFEISMLNPSNTPPNETTPPNPSLTPPLTRDQAFKHMSLWGSFSLHHRQVCIQTIQATQKFSTPRKTLKLETSNQRVLKRKNANGLEFFF